MLGAKPLGSAVTVVIAGELDHFAAPQIRRRLDELLEDQTITHQRVSHKLQLCPEEYLPIVEGAIDGALRIHEQEKEPVCV